MATRSIDSVAIWQRWNDYGSRQVLKGNAELKQAEAAFIAVEGLGRFDGSLNLARVFQAEGRLDEAITTLSRVAELSRGIKQSSPPVWTMSWLEGVINE